MKLVRTTERTFAILVAGRRLSKKSLSIARAVLVDGRAYADVAVEYGVSRQYVYLLMHKITKRYAMSVPVGDVVRVEVDMPDYLAMKLASPGYNPSEDMPEFVCSKKEMQNA